MIQLLLTAALYSTPQNVEEKYDIIEIVLKSSDKTTDKKEEDQCYDLKINIH